MEENNVGAVILGSTVGIVEGSSVYGTKSVVSVPVSDSILGRVVNSLGEPIDGKADKSKWVYASWACSLWNNW